MINFLSKKEYYTNQKDTNPAVINSKNAQKNHPRRESVLRWITLFVYLGGTLLIITMALVVVGME